MASKDYVKGFGVLGACIHLEDGSLAMSPLYMVKVNDKTVFTHYSFMKAQGGYKSPLGSMKEQMFMSLEGITNFSIVDLPATANLEATIRATLLEAEDREAFLFRWVETEANDNPFFAAANLKPNNAERPLFLDEAGLDISEPFSFMSREEFAN